MNERSRQNGMEHWKRARSKGAPIDMFDLERTIASSLDGVDGSPVKLLSSRKFDPVSLPDGFAKEVRDAHGGYRSGRSDKGRLFYVTVGGTPIGFVGFHVPGGTNPLVIEDVVVDTTLPRKARSFVRAKLIGAVLEASELAGRAPGRLGWSTGDPVRADRVRKLGFTDAPKPKDAGLLLDHYLERTY